MLKKKERLGYVASFHKRGIDYHYYRRERGAFKIRLQGTPGSGEFLRSYLEAEKAFQAKLANTPPIIHATTVLPRTLGALIVKYRSTPEWRALGDATRTDYEKGLGFLEDNFSRGPVAKIARKDVRAIRDAAATRTIYKRDANGVETTEQVTVASRANKVITMLSILLSLAVEEGWVTANVALRFPKLETGGDGYRAWTEEEVAKFTAWAEDRPFWRLAFKIALYTGQRGQDQVRMTWQHTYSGTHISLRQLKTDAFVTIPVHSALKVELDSAERHGDHILMRTFDRARKDVGREKGAWEAWERNAFQGAASDAIRDAGLTGVVWHGLRATATTRLAESGASERQIMAITGHRTPQMVQKYANGARREVLADEAMALLETFDNHSPAGTVSTIEKEDVSTSLSETLTTAVSR